MVGKGGAAMGLQRRPGGELGGYQIEAFINGDGLLFQLEVVDVPVAVLGWDGELQGPFMLGEGLGRRDRNWFTAIDPEPIGACTDGPSGE